MLAAILCLLLCLRLVQEQDINPCKEYTTCKQCVRSSSCKWCSSEDFKNIERCMSITTNNMKECPEAYIQNPNGSVNYLINHDFSSEIQLKPQRLKVKLRPSQTQTFALMFKAAKDYPVDLYFLFDCSNSMQSAINRSAEASERIYKQMTSKTANVLLGMGTFSDKNVAPFVSDKTNKISSFSHKLSMTDNFNLLRERMYNVANNIETNTDGPESGFDALAQIISCRKEIGWRNDSRKFIFLFTNAACHTAGDGKPAGIVYPYDGECYTVNGVYIKESELDYPSIGMINELAVKEGVTIVFVVFDHSLEDYYKRLTKNIHGSKSLMGRETMILQHIITEYENTTQNIKLDVIMAPEDHGNIEVTFEPDCKNNNCPTTRNPTEPFIIQGYITLLRYYKKDQINVEVTIQNIKERLTLDIEVADCDCEIERDSSYCSHNGIKNCGICECNPGRTGSKCECKVDGASCKQPGVKDASICNGKGVCECGDCHCDNGYAGDYCECKSNRCVKNCNGHGNCYCGKCTCKAEWDGEYCDCHKTQPCKTVNGKVCNNRGICLCGKCNCDSPAVWDARDQHYETCEMKCAECHDNQCLKLKDCAICRQSYDENYCSSSCGDIRVKVVEALSNLTVENTSICKNIQAEPGCYTRFHYKYDDYHYMIHLFVQTEMDCLPSYYKWGGGILISLLVIGLMTLVGWKLLTDYRDRQEYKRFLKMHSADSQGGCQNPIYENPTTTIRNPAFRKPSVDCTLR